MLVLLAVAGYLAAGGVILYLASRLSRTSGKLFGANQDLSRARAQQQAAKKAAAEAQERCRQLVSQLDHSISSTGQALSVARHVEVIAAELHEFFELVMYPQLAQPARHALPEQAPPALAGPHIHADHQDGSAVSIASGAAVHYIRED
jgi:hypothetical protein